MCRVIVALLPRCAVTEYMCKRVLASNSLFKVLFLASDPGINSQFYPELSGSLDLFLICPSPPDSNLSRLIVITQIPPAGDRVD